jgi:hypothetical protein
LESLTAFRREPAPILVIEFVKGRGDSECSYSEVDGRRVDRLAGETKEDFTNRIIDMQEGTSAVCLYCE